jgi:hypothetical protein
MSEDARRVLFVATRDDVPDSRDDRIVVVCDTSWTPTAAERPDVRSLRPLIGHVVETRAVPAEALTLLETWARATDAVARTMFDGIALWYQLQEGLWRWLHERMLWACAIAEIAGPGTMVEAAEPVDAALLDVLRARAGGQPSPSAPPPQLGATSVTSNGVAPRAAAPATAGLRRFGRALLRRSPSSGGSTRPTMAIDLDGRVARAAARAGRGVLVLSYLRVAQRVGDTGSGGLVDANLKPIIDRLEEIGLEPTVLALGLDGRSPEIDALIAADDRVLPDRLLAIRWSESASSRTPTAETDALGEAVDGTPIAPLEVAGIDLGRALQAELRTRAGAAAAAHARVSARVGRMLDELRPTAMILTHEGLRTAWLAAAERRRIPTFAIQHGVVYPTHPGYRHDRVLGLVLPTKTLVAGDFVRRSLLAAGGYREDEVEVTGPPRGDLDGSTVRVDRATERQVVRQELGVADGDRLLVVSTVNEPFIQRSHYAHMFERMLGAPLPRVHVVFKQHPGERDAGPYGDLLVGMAVAGGYDPPPFSVVRDVDLFRLLRAADAHLGLFSTVLTDAVVAGTSNLYADVDAHGDLLGYVAAGVARPVRSPADLLAALDDPRPSDPAARQAFLGDHQRPGDATARIVEIVTQAVSRDMATV